MKSLLRAFISGKLHPLDGKTTHSFEYRLMEKEYDAELALLVERLSDENKHRLYRIIELQTNMSADSYVDISIDNFCLGALFMSEVWGRTTYMFDGE